MELLIDNRETRLIEHFRTVNPDIKINIAQLQVGDIIIKYDDYQMLIERKTVADLLSSIVYGRYREQKVRINAYINEIKPIKGRAVYIIEGTYDKAAPVFSKLTKERERSTYTGSLISTQLRDGIPIFSSIDIEDTAYIIMRFMSRMQSNCKELYSTILNMNSEINSSSSAGASSSSESIIENTGAD